MEPAIKRVFIFCHAGRTEIETRHGCLGTVVGDIFDYCESGAAIGAVNKRVPVPAIRWSEQFTQTIPADADVRGYWLESAINRPGMEDLKRLMVIWRNFFEVERINLSQRGSFSFQA